MVEQRMDLSELEPGAFKAVMGLEQYLAQTDIEGPLMKLIKIRASQINGCAFCLNMHTRDARKEGESEKRIYGLEAWRESPLYTEEERAALDMTESVTLVSETHVPDEVYNHALGVFGEQKLGQIIMAIAAINVWNRIAISTRMMPED